MNRSCSTENSNFGEFFLKSFDFVRFLSLQTSSQLIYITSTSLIEEVINIPPLCTVKESVTEECKKDQKQPCGAILSLWTFSRPNSFLRKTLYTSSFPCDSFLKTCAWLSEPPKGRRVKYLVSEKYFAKQHLRFWKIWIFRRKNPVWEGYQLHLGERVAKVALIALHVCHPSCLMRVAGTSFHCQNNCVLFLPI